MIETKEHRLFLEQRMPLWGPSREALQPCAVEREDLTFRFSCQENGGGDDTLIIGSEEFQSMTCPAYRVPSCQDSCLSKEMPQKPSGRNVSPNLLRNVGTSGILRREGRVNGRV